MSARVRASPSLADDSCAESNVPPSVAGRVCFHLAENQEDPSHPFAFLATVTVGLGAGEKARHQRLSQALKESVDTQNQAALLRLLEPVHSAAQQSAFVKALVESNAIFRTQRWTASQAHAFLLDVPALESSGVVVRVPNWWKSKGSSRVTVQVTLGETASSAFSAEAILGFDIGLALDDEPISDEEWAQLRASTERFVRLRGQWVEMDRTKLEEVLGAWNAAQADSSGGVSIHEAMRLLAGVDRPAGVPASGSEETSWARVVAGRWLEDTLERLRHPEAQGSSLPGPELKATLRPYQASGVQWLGFLNQLGIGGCLADDMGLGKTIQVLALLLVLKARKVPQSPHLLVVPASLLGNWQTEAARFAPSLRMHVAHKSGDGIDEETARKADVVVTTYGTLARTAWMRASKWDTVVIDEAQAIKNPGAQQTKAAKALQARVRLALTGTPVENRAGDLWSLFDFLQPGLLGTVGEFGKLASKSPDWSPVRTLVSPYILRRLKTDEGVAPDLPAKTELRAECGLSREQAALYQQTIKELAAKLDTASGMERRGLVLATLIRLKQICNHPSHWLGDGGWETKRSGKLQRVVELVEPIAARQEKVLVFTQFREAVGPLSMALQHSFGRAGLVLHGQTPVKKRQALVDQFQNDESFPFMVLSLKAGGTGLNLTAATHVIHFDRWWNPAVEDQATDRAFRIGQKHAVFVHKLVCRGTIEEKVDRMIAAKRGLAKQLLSGDVDEVRLTELSNDELLKVVSLDLTRAHMGG